MKKCNKCGEEKELTEFYKNKLGKFGVKSFCKKCEGVRTSIRQKNQLKIKRDKKIELESKEIAAEIKQCKKCKIVKKFKDFNKNNHCKYGFNSVCKKCKSEYHKNNYNKEKRKEYSQNEDTKKRVNKYYSEKYKNDPVFKLRKILTSRTWEFLKGINKSLKNEELLGCSYEQAKEHIESIFKPGMTWENWALDGWHIDHIRPVCSFDISDPEQLKQCCHYLNLQPMWAEENLSKGGKWVDTE